VTGTGQSSRLLVSHPVEFCRGIKSVGSTAAVAAAAVKGRCIAGKGRGFGVKLLHAVQALPLAVFVAASSIGGFI
jgi:hypothetical protein